VLNYIHFGLTSFLVNCFSTVVFGALMGIGVWAVSNLLAGIEAAQNVLK
jgi:hypothetical protein